MARYCGIDLHSTNCWITIIDEDRNLIQESKFGNDLAAILRFFIGATHGTHGNRLVYIRRMLWEEGVRQPWPGLFSRTFRVPRRWWSRFRIRRGRWSWF